MPATAELITRFRDLHVPGSPLLIPNPWDIGSAKVLESLGFQALATTSAGFASSKGLTDGAITLDQLLEHCTDLVGCTELPISADFENGFADSPEEVAANVARAAATGLAGLSVEDYTRNSEGPIYPLEHAAARIEAAAGASEIVLTARAENHLNGISDLKDTIARLQAYQEAGADVLYAPGLTDPDDIATVVREVDRPVNVLLMPQGPTPAQLTELGVARISVGSWFAKAARQALEQAGRELLAMEWRPRSP